MGNVGEGTPMPPYFDEAVDSGSYDVDVYGEPERACADEIDGVSDTLTDSGDSSF